MLNLFKFNNKGTSTTSLTYFVVNFAQINAGWVASDYYKTSKVQDGNFIKAIKVQGLKVGIGEI